MWFVNKRLPLGGRVGPRPRPSRMGVTRRPVVALVALAAAAAIAAGCSSNNSGSGSSGSSGGGAYGSTGTSSAGSAQSGVATVKSASSKVGTILVDGNGRTLYLFEIDQPNRSVCAGACAAAWPIDQTSAAPKAAGQVKASLLGTIKRSDGTTQVTYNRHPLYYYAGDTAAGQLNGQGLNAFGGGWDVLSPSGNKIEGGSS
jgi:predicted lipoprotein with Yx(FWY)xxD motif